MFRRGLSQFRQYDADVHYAPLATWPYQAEIMVRAYRRAPAKFPASTPERKDFAARLLENRGIAPIYRSNGA